MSVLPLISVPGDDVWSLVCAQAIGVKEIKIVAKMQVHFMFRTPGPRKWPSPLSIVRRSSVSSVCIPLRHRYLD